MESYCIRAFAEALEVIPYTLAENAGLNPIEMVTELRNRHAKGETSAGINVRKGQVTNMMDENVVQPLLVTTSAITLACECVRMILKVRQSVALSVSLQQCSRMSNLLTSMHTHHVKCGALKLSPYLPGRIHRMLLHTSIMTPTTGLSSPAAVLVSLQ